MYRLSILEPKVKPVRAGEDRAEKQHEKHQQDDATATSGAGCPSSKTKTVLQPIENPVEKRQLE